MSTPVIGDVDAIHVAAALFCDQVIEGKDGVLTAVRITDQVTLRITQPDAPEQLPPGTVSCWVLLTLKAERHIGTVPVRMVFCAPNGDRNTMVDMQVTFSESPLGYSSINVQGEVPLPIRDEGVHWFDVLAGDRLLTRMPLAVVYERRPTPDVARGPNSQPTEA